MKYNGTSWVSVGSSGMSPGAANYPCITLTPTGMPIVLFSDNTNNCKATCMEYNGISWSALGILGLSTGHSLYNAITSDGTPNPYIAFSDSVYDGKINVMKYNGSSWTNTGSADFSAGQTLGTSIITDANSKPFVAYVSGGLFTRKLDCSTGIDELEAEQQVLSYPNPCQTTFTLDHLQPGSTIEIYTTLGDLVWSQKSNKESEVIDMTTLAKGMYFVQIRYQNSSGRCLKVIKN
jgi:hypothetical protein